MAHRVVMVAGDGIGPEVAAAARHVLDATGVDLEWFDRPAGASALEHHGSLLPEDTLDAIRDCRVALKGPITTPVGTGFRSVNVALRQDLDLFAAVRPARSLPGVPTRHDGVDLVVVRENTEDLYQGIEFERGSEEARALRARLRDLGGFEVREDAGITLKPISLSGTHRIVRFAFEYARANRRTKVTVGHKAGVMRYSDGLFLETARADARGYPDVAWEEIQVDHLSAWLVRRPSDFDVLLLPNLYGDILSDLCAGLVGGLGLIPGANIGWEYAVFEPVHGSAPDIAGKGVANPIAMILSAAMLLRHVGERDAASRVEAAVDAVLRDGNVRTGDLGGGASTLGDGRHDRVRRTFELGAGRRLSVFGRMRLGAPTGARIEASTAGCAVVAAAPVARCADPVPHRDREPARDRQIRVRPVREEVPGALAADLPERHRPSS